MIFKDLIKQVTWKEIAEKLPILYSTYCPPLDGYEHVYKLLLKKRARKSEPPLTIELEWIEGDEKQNEPGYWCVTGRDRGDDNMAYSLSLTSFSKWLGFTIDVEGLRQADKVNLVCHCLWEMTFYGFSDREVRNVSRMLKYRMKSVEAHPERLIPQEDVQKKILRGK